MLAAAALSISSSSLAPVLLVVVLVVVVVVVLVVLVVVLVGSLAWLGTKSPRILLWTRLVLAGPGAEVLFTGAGESYKVKLKINIKYNI